MSGVSMANEVVATDTTDADVPVGALIDWYGSLYGLATPDGYWPCNGTIINSPGSLLHNKVAPDLRDKVVAGASSTNTAGTVAGSNSLTITQGHLPKSTLSGDAAYTPAGTLDSKVLTGKTASTSISIPGSDMVSSGSTFLAGQAPMNQGQINVTIDSHNHTFTGTAATITTSNIQLNPGTQTAIAMRSATLYVTKLIKL